MMAGEKDIVCEFSFTLELFNKIIAPDKKIHTFKEGLHSPHHDIEYDEWLGVLDEWTTSKITTFTPDSHRNLQSSYPFQITSRT